MAEEVVFEDITPGTKIKKHNEVRDIIIAWIAISICFTLVIGGFNVFDGAAAHWAFNWNKLGLYMLISLFATGTAFILHELAHKYSAIHLGAKASFVMWKNSLLMSIGFAALVGFVFVAPGAVYIFGKRLSVKEDGLTSLAGPATNITLAILFILIYLILGSPSTGIIAPILGFGIIVNFWIAFFNLLPIGPLDGKKIFIWNPFIWTICIIVSIGGYLLFSGIIPL